MLKNPTSLLERTQDISPGDKKRVWEFIELLKALRVSKGRIAKYLFHLRKIGENLGVPFEAATRKDIERFVATWLYEDGYSAETTAEDILEQSHEPNSYDKNMTKVITSFKGP
ncbi:MAG: hypothetical protein JRN20_16425 [Nitrososphaerota archaeon]|nr:hypothetical protein [Nitrososphaerota archaeon]MDG6922278.1 hypothetical protein [Nitrososphaerota archaeon]